MMIHTIHSCHLMHIIYLYTVISVNQLKKNAYAELQHRNISSALLFSLNAFLQNNYLKMYGGFWKTVWQL